MNCTLSPTRGPGFCCYCLPPAQIYSPVCGEDGKDYSNACYALCVGLTRFRFGTCAGDSLVVPDFGTAQITDGSVRSWGVDRLDQVGAMKAVRRPHLVQVLKWEGGTTMLALQFAELGGGGGGPGGARIKETCCHRPGIGDSASATGSNGGAAGFESTCVPVRVWRRRVARPLLDPYRITPKCCCNAACPPPPGPCRSTSRWTVPSALATWTAAARMASPATACRRSPPAVGDAALVLALSASIMAPAAAAVSAHSFCPVGAHMCERCAPKPPPCGCPRAVYILDTGVRTSHADFSGRVGEGTSLLGGSSQDDHGHGTHVAGIAVGGIHGVARGAILHAVKVLDSSGSGSYSNIISGLGW